MYTPTHDQILKSKIFQLHFVYHGREQVTFDEIVTALY